MLMITFVLGCVVGCFVTCAVVVLAQRHANTQAVCNDTDDVPCVLTPIDDSSYCNECSTSIVPAWGDTCSRCDVLNGELLYDDCDDASYCGVCGDECSNEVCEYCINAPSEYTPMIKHPDTKW